MRLPGESNTRYGRRWQEWAANQPTGADKRARHDVSREVFRPEADEDDNEVVLLDSDEEDVGVKEKFLRKEDGELVAVLQQERGTRAQKRRKRKRGRPKKDKHKAHSGDGQVSHRDYSSTAWVFFDLQEMLAGDNPLLKLKCRVCDKSLSYNREDARTTNLLDHAKSHAKLYAAARAIDLKGKDAYFSLENFQQLKRDAEKQRNIMAYFSKAPEVNELVIQFVCWIISADVPLRKFTNKYWLPFKNSVQAASNGAVKLPNVKVITKYIAMISWVAEDTAIKSIKESGSVSLAIDMWTSLARDHFMGATYHWIDRDFNLRSQVMELFAFFGSATALMIKNVLEERFTTMFDDDVLISSIVSYSGANVKAARDELVPGDSEDCLPLRLQLAVLHVIDSLGNKHHRKDIEMDLDCLSNWMVWIQGSAAREQQLSNAMPEGKSWLSPLQANKTRWWGLCRVLKRVIHLKEALIHSAEQNGVAAMRDTLHGPADFLSRAFWLRVDEYARIFECLNKLSVQSQAEKTETKSLVVGWIFETQNALKSAMLEAPADLNGLWQSFISSFEESMLPLTSTATNTTAAFVLNPQNYELVSRAGDGSDDLGSRVQPRYLNEELIEQCWGRIREEAEEYGLQEIKKKYPTDLWRRDRAEQNVNFAIRAAKTHIEAQVQLVASTDVADQHSELLEFWHRVIEEDEATRALAPSLRAILCIPASAAGPERLFSLTGRLVTADRNQFKPQTVSMRAKAHSYLQTPPPGTEHWEGPQRKRSKPSHLATVSSSTLKRLIQEVDPDEGIASIEERLQKRRKRLDQALEEAQDDKQE